MELQEAIKNRRSIRKYKEEPVLDEDLEKILQAGTDAPSAGNLQSRFFYVVKDLETRRKIARASHDQHFISQAPVTIVVCADARINSRYGERGEKLYSILDCAASVQNMMLTAYGLGLGTCWVGLFDEQEVARIINCSPYHRPVSLFPLGYPDDSPKQPPKKNKDEISKVI